MMDLRFVIRHVTMIGLQSAILCQSSEGLKSVGLFGLFKRFMLCIVICECAFLAKVQCLISSVAIASLKTVRLQV